MSKKFQTNKKVAETIFGTTKANKILADKLTEEELKEAEYTEEDKAEDDLIQSVVDKFLVADSKSKNMSVSTKNIIVLKKRVPSKVKV